MTDENLGEVLDQSYRAHQRTVAIKNLGDRTHLTLGQISKLCDHPQHGETVATITLRELLDAEDAKRAVPRAQPDTMTSPRSAKKRGAKKAAKKKTSQKNTSRRGAKADKGKPKPRLDYETGMREVLAALRAAKEPQGRTSLEKATGYTGVQIRAFMKRLAGAGKANILGEGGRSTKYEAA